MQDAANLSDRIRRSRPYAAARGIRDRLAHLLFERGLEGTGGKTDLDAFGLDHPERREYLPSGWRFLTRALKRRTVGPDDVFLDVGSGKGRVVWQAAQYPFKRVIGVELAEDLNAVARRNIEHNRDRLVCRDVELITADAAEYEIPDDVTFVYFYSPFSGELFRRALANVIASVDRRPRELTLIYANPVMAAEVEATGRFERVEMIKPRRRDPELTSTVFVYASRT